MAALGNHGGFIALEGPDGVGKTTQVELLVASLRRAGHSVLQTREPGGTDLGEALREVLIGSSGISAESELLILQAARAEHLDKVILPALREGSVVVTDRYVGSSLAYQGHARGLGFDRVMASFHLIEEARLPDLTILLDAEDPLEAFSFDEGDLYESEGLTFWGRVRDGYREAAALFGWTVIEASGTVEEVARSVGGAVRSMGVVA